MLESTSGYPRGQDTEEVLINFSEEELDYVNAGTVEIQRVYLLGNEAEMLAKNCVQYWHDFVPKMIEKTFFLWALASKTPSIGCLEI